jgi:hypothetical protein
MLQNDSFKIPHYRVKLTNSFWRIVFYYQTELEKWLNANNYDSDKMIFESIDSDDEEQIVIMYQNCISYTVSISKVSKENYIEISQTATSEDTEIIKKFDKMMEQTNEKLLNRHYEDEHELEEEFQLDCAIEYAMDNM